MKRTLFFLTLAGLVLGTTLPVSASWDQIDKEASPNAMAQQFGWSVAISRDRAIVGDPDDDLGKGAAHVYQRDSAGNWVLQTSLTAPGATSGDNFGYAVDIYSSGSVCRAVVSARGEDLSTGSAFVYTCGNWASPQKITGSNTVFGDIFGHSVSIGSDRLLVGSPSFNGGGASSAGGVFVFERDAADFWFESDLLVADGAPLGGQLGWSVALAGSRAAAGAPNTNGTEGAAYVFEHDGTDWDQKAQLVADNPSVNDKLGWSVGLSGSYVIAGAFGEDTGGANSGAAYIFKRDGDSWALDTMLKASDRESGDQFGTSVHLRGGWAVVGAPSEDEGGWSAGAIYVFQRDNCGIWRQRDKIVADDPEANAFLGWSVQAGSRTSSTSHVLRLYLTVIGGARGDGASGAAYWFEDEIPAFITDCRPKEKGSLEPPPDH